jgi:hypothetical protein
VTRFNIIGERKNVDTLFQGKLTKAIVINEWYEREPEADLEIQVPDELVDALTDELDLLSIAHEML